MKIKFPLVLTTLSLCAASAFAQAQSVPVPASSVNGGRAVVAITMPVIPALPSNICTSTNGNCVTAATLPSQVAPLLPSPDKVKGTFATDYAYYDTNPYGTEVHVVIGFVCVWGMGDQNYSLFYSFWAPPASCPAGSGAMNLSSVRYNVAAQTTGGIR